MKTQQRPPRWKAALQLLLAAGALLLLVGAYVHVQSLTGAALDRVSVFAALIAAVAGALAALAAWRTAKASERAAVRSARTAEDASQALALATKPDPGFNISHFNPGSVTDRTATITLENRSQWPLVDPIVKWSCRGGIQGSRHLTTLPARTTPYGSGFVQKEAPAVLEVKGIDTTQPGTDEVTVEFGTQYGSQRWTVTRGFIYGAPKMNGFGPEPVGQVEPVVRAIDGPTIAR